MLLTVFFSMLRPPPISARPDPPCPHTTPFRSLDNLPPGAGIVFRHYRTPLAERRRLFAGVQAIADRRGLVLVRAGADRLAAREDGVHNARRHPDRKSVV